MPWRVHRGAWALPIAFALVLPGCKDGDGQDGDAAFTSPLPGENWTSRLEQPDLDAVLAALGQRHHVVREAIGPHELRYEATFDLVPEPERAEPPAVDENVVDPQSVHDELALVWAGEATGAGFSLAQGNDHDRGRDVVVKDGRLYSRMRPRAFTVHELETTVFELWLDDAQHAVHDAVQFAAPGLAIASEQRQGGGLAEGDAVAITLSAADTVDPARNYRVGPTGPEAPDLVSKWRGDVAFEAISGTVLIDQTTGAWLQADIELRWSLPGGDGRPLRGAMNLVGNVTALAAEKAQVVAPADAVPLPERTRYEAERQRLLDGLAAP
jgi:hypothetical protein